jgi:hypothetical protein
LLKGATDQGNIPNQILYLTQLIYIHEQAKQPAQAIPYQQQLIALYQQQPQTPPPQNPPNPIPKLSLKLGDNYASTGKLDQAKANLAKLQALCGTCEQAQDLEAALKSAGA